MKATTLTDAEGRFEFRNLNPGQYRLRAHSWEGFHYLENNPIIQVLQEESVQEFQFTMAPFRKGVFTSYGVTNGLPDMKVQALWQDRNGSGLLWIGTRGGLSRFDGSKFDNFTTGNGMIDNDVRGVARDGANRLWIATATGVSLSDGVNFTNFDADADGLALGEVNGIAVHPSGYPWFATRYGGITTFRDDDIVRITDDDSGRYGVTHKMTFGPNRDLWFGGRGSLWGPFELASNRERTGIGDVAEGVDLDVGGSGHNPTVAYDGAVWFGAFGGGLRLWRPQPSKEPPRPRVSRSLPAPDRSHCLQQPTPDDHDKRGA